MLATNPCRIRHYGQELVFFRHDVQKSLLCQNTKISPFVVEKGTQLLSLISRRFRNLQISVAYPPPPSMHPHLPTFARAPTHGRH